MEFKGNPSKNSKQINFPVYLQQHDNTCGPACMAMIAEWATGLPQSEYSWCKIIKPIKYGASSSCFDKAFNKITDDKCRIEFELDNLKGNKSVINVEKVFSIEEKSSENSLVIDDIGDSVIYLALIDSYSVFAENLQHWIVLVGVKRCEERTIVIYADPLETRLQAWDWESLKAAKIRALYKVKRNER